MPKRSIVPLETLSADTQRFFDVLNHESDLAVVLVAASYLDASLAALLERVFQQNSGAAALLDARGGALGALRPRADACYALGMVEKPIYQAICKVSEIRNAFAHHHLEKTFDDPEVESLCQQLCYLETLEDTQTGTALFGPALTRGARSRFVLTSVMLSQRLLLIGLGARRAVGQATTAADGG